MSWAPKSDIKFQVDGSFNAPTHYIDDAAAAWQQTIREGGLSTINFARSFPPTPGQTYVSVYIGDWDCGDDAGTAYVSGAATGSYIAINGCLLDRDGEAFLKYILLHEMGHIAGLNDVEIEGCNMATLMYKYYSGPGQHATQITPSDICSANDMAIRAFLRSDNDGDGFSIGDGDCNDGRADIYPGAPIGCSPNADDPDMNCNGTLDTEDLNCDYGPSPLLIDIDGTGFRLTSSADGVLFDLDSDGTPEALSWTARDSTNAWLTLDRNSNGTIDNGKEMFGNFTPQPLGPNPNGFFALGLYDAPEFGGDSDGQIDSNDKIWTQLRLWVDRNHDGVSQADELTPIASTRIERISLDFHSSHRRDAFGNEFRYRSRAYVQGGHERPSWWVVDVYLRPGALPGIADWWAR